MTNSVSKTLSRSRMPLYAQLASLMRQRIRSGEWGAGQKLPTIKDLETEFGVARVTVRQALDLLEEEGLIWRKQGKGTFVTQGVSDQAWLPLGTQWDSLMNMLDGTTLSTLSVEQVKTPRRLRKEDGRTATGYQYLRRIHAKGEAPYCVIDLFLAESLYARSPRRFRSELALRVISELEGVVIGSARQTLTIGAADMTAAEVLEIEVGAPVAQVRRVITDADGVVIYFAEIVYRGDFVKLDIDLLSGRTNIKGGG